MRPPRIIARVRGHIARTLGIQSQEAATGAWWEIDLILVVFGGSIAIGIAALIQF